MIVCAIAGCATEDGALERSNGFSGHNNASWVEDCGEGGVGEGPDGGDLYPCLNLLAGQVDLDGAIELHPQLRGPYAEGLPIVVSSPSIVEAVPSPGGGTAYERTPLRLEHAFTDEWHLDEPFALVDAGTDRDALRRFCGRELTLEITVAAHARGDHHLMGSTAWFRGFPIDCN